MSRTYVHLSVWERHYIAELRKIDVPIREIGRMLKRSASTISRELRRNQVRGAYRVEPAHALAVSCRRIARKTRIFFCPRMRRRLVEALRKSWSPDQAAGRARFEGHPFASCSTIYRYLEGKPRSRRWLRGVTRKRRRDKRRKRIHDIKMITDRPNEVDQRERFGDWEADTIRGPIKTDACVGTFIERLTGYLVAAKLEHRGALPLNEAAIDGLQAYPVHTMTVDNGMEFASFKELESGLNTEVYFCHPRSPWERGQGEQINGLLRHYFPRGTDFTEVASTALARAVEALNNRPRKRLGYQTPAEAFEDALLHLQ